MMTYWKWGRRYLCIPDQYITWLPFALAKAIQINRREPFDVVMTTAPHYSTFIVGWCIKRLAGKPWIVDFRDPWTGCHFRSWMPSWRARFEYWLERTIIRRADHLIAVSPRMSEHIQSLHADFSPERIHVITNGYDDDFSDLKASTSPGNSFTINYTGALYGLRCEAVRSFLSAVGELLCEKDGLRQSMRINFCGKVGFEEEQTLKSIIDKYQLAPVVNFEPYIKHKEALQAQATASVNLLIVEDLNNCDLVIPSKTFEYLVAGPPILALVPEGDCKRLILESRAGVTCHPLDVEGIKEALGDLIEAHQRGELDTKADPSVLYRYHRRELTSQLSRVLDVIGTPQIE
jgi:glycosyltransferase involved in cell wall biosynthesis